MKLSLAECRTAAAARQGRQAAHVARDAAPRAPPRHHVSLVLRSGVSQRRIARACARSCRDLVTIPRTETAKGTPRSTLDAARYLVDRVPYARREISLATHYRDARRAAARTDARSMPSSAISSCRSSICPNGCPARSILFTHNVEAEIWRRHAENAANPVVAFLLRSSGGGCCASNGDALSRFDLVLAVSDADRQTFERLYPDACARRSTSCRRASTPRTSRRRTKPPPARASGVHRIDGLAAERRRDAVLRPRHSAADPAGRARRDARASSGESPTPAVKRLADDRRHRGHRARGRREAARRARARSTLSRCGSAAARG